MSGSWGTDGHPRGSVRAQPGRAGEPAAQHIQDYTLDVLTAAADYTRIAWNGAVAIAGGQLRIDNGGATDWAAGHVLVVAAYGSI